MDELVRAHATLEEPMEAAIWIRVEDREAWLVELLPDMGDDEHPERPVAFNPGRSFRHPLNLIASNMDGLQRAIRTNATLARDVAEGAILLGSERAEELQRLAREASDHARAG